MKRLNKTRIGITIIILVVVSTTLLLTINKNEEETIKLGSILILTGEGASWGIAEKNGIDLAIEDINSQGGINGKKLTINHQDDGGDPKTAVSAFNSLNDVSGIDLIIGTTWSRTGLTLINLANENGVLMISPSLGVKEFNEGSKFLFNTWPHDYILSENLADLVFNKGHRRVALIGAKEVWVQDQTNAFKRKFEELGGSIEVLVEPDTNDKTPYSDALKVKEAANSVDAIVSTTDGVLVGVLVAKRIRELGVTLPIYSITLDQNTIDAAEGAYENLEFLTSLTPREDFKQRYESKFGSKIEIGADSAYDAVMLIAQAIKETKSENPEVLQEYLNNLKDYNGVSGNLVADGKGGFTKKFVLKKVINGKPVDI